MTQDLQTRLAELKESYANICGRIKSLQEEGRNAVETAHKIEGAITTVMDMIEAERAGDPP